MQAIIHNPSASTYSFFWYLLLALALKVAFGSDPSFDPVSGGNDDGFDGPGGNDGGSNAGNGRNFEGDGSNPLGNQPLSGYQSDSDNKEHQPENNSDSLHFSAPVVRPNSMSAPKLYCLDLTHYDKLTKSLFENESNKILFDKGDKIENTLFSENNKENFSIPAHYPPSG